jgi:hypothetical protein
VHAQPAAARPLCPSHWHAINFFFFFFFFFKHSNIPTQEVTELLKQKKERKEQTATC